MMKVVTNLGGHWPQWFGCLDKQFVYVRIRHGEHSIGVGRSWMAAMNNAMVVGHSSETMGVSDIHNAIDVLRSNGYLVKSIIVPEHIEELE